jgi:hypothetical protein
MPSSNTSSDRKIRHPFHEKACIKLLWKNALNSAFPEITGKFMASLYFVPVPRVHNTAIMAFHMERKQFRKWYKHYGMTCRKILPLFQALDGV